MGWCGVACLACVPRGVSTLYAPLSTRVARLVRQEEKWWKKRGKSFKRRLKIKVKIMCGFYQAPPIHARTRAFPLPPCPTLHYQLTKRRCTAPFARS